MKKKIIIGIIVVVAVAATSFAILVWNNYTDIKAKEERVDELTLKSEGALEKAKEALEKGDSLSVQQYIDEAEMYTDEAKKYL